MTETPSNPPLERDAELSRETLLAQLGHYCDPATGAVAPPIHTATTYARGADYQLPGEYVYGRNANPTYEPVERLLAKLDGGAAALLFASGQAAAAAVFETVRAGERVVAPRIMYHGAQDWLRRLAERRGLDLALVDPTDLEAVRTGVEGGPTALLWVETLLNPTWDVVDLKACAAIAHGAGARFGVDATATPPVALRPIEWGADIVFHSATKYLNGHSDVTAGALITREADAHWEEIGLIRKLNGGVMGPFEAWALGRGMRTLALRYERACASAARVARHFEHHGRLLRVLYPGLSAHPGHALAAAQMDGRFGAMLSFLIDGDGGAAKRIAAATRVFMTATSLGGVESLIEHRATVEGPLSAVPKNLLRLSIGVEDPDDLIADLEQALGGLSGR